MSQPLTHQTYVLCITLTADFAAFATEAGMEGAAPDVVAQQLRADLLGYVEQQADTIRKYSPFLTVGRADVTATT